MSAWAWVRVRTERAMFSGGSWSLLGWVRLLFYGCILALTFIWFQRDIPLWASVSSVFWQPIPLFGLLRLPVLPAGILLATFWTWRLTLLGCAAGIGGAPLRVLCLALGTYLLGLPQNFMKVHHSDAILVIGLAIFAVARADEAWSLRSLMAAARGQARRSSPTAEARWPIALLQLMLLLVLWSAAVAKLWNGGLGWAASNSLYYTILWHQYTYSPPLNVGPLLTAVPMLSHLLAAAALTVEFLAPTIFLLRGRWQALAASVLFGMMLGFGLALDVFFLPFLMLIVVLFTPWELAGAWVASRQSLPGFAVLYDGSCGICQRTMAVLRRLDVFGRLEILDVLADWPRIAARYPSLSQEACLVDMHVVRKPDAVFAGFEAYRAIATSLPLLWPLRAVAALPGVAPLGRRIYRHVASGRHDAGCPVPDAGDSRAAQTSPVS